ncbi:MAG: zinc ribbon domain-containing protein [Phycisphaerales bacterium]|nr:zinc ribbon domain-containing protein [Phycisphaerales bacterium]
MLEATWVLFGALVGALIADKRGWPVLYGVFGGMLLGIFAPLMYFVSGITRDDRTKVCPQCAERIKPQAKVCRYCGERFASTEPPAQSGLIRWTMACADRDTGTESVETVIAASESEARDVLADRGKLVARILSSERLGDSAAWRWGAMARRWGAMIRLWR